MVNRKTPTTEAAKPSAQAETRQPGSASLAAIATGTAWAMIACNAGSCRSNVSTSPNAARSLRKKNRPCRNSLMPL
jgi:hypothetical protein